MSHRVLITGASGALGPRVVRAFSDEGYGVRTFSIDSAPEGTFPSGVEILIGDITDKKAVVEAMSGVDSVVHMAALLHINNPSSALKPKYRRINVDGTNHVIQAALCENVRRIIFFSTIAVYGPGNGMVLSEESVPHPDTIYSETKVEGEKIVLAAKRSDGVPLGTVLRLGAVYGARIKGNYFRLVKALERNRFIPIGKGNNRRTLVYEKDVIRAVLLAVQRPSAAGKYFNVTDGQFHELHEIIMAICVSLGRKPPRFSIPVGPVRFAVGFIEDTMRLIGKRSPFNRETIDKYTEDVAVEGRRIQEELGFVPQYNLASGWRETIEDMRETGVL